MLHCVHYFSADLFCSTDVLKQTSVSPAGWDDNPGRL